MQAPTLYQRISSGSPVTPGDVEANCGNRISYWIDQTKSGSRISYSSGGPLCGRALHSQPDPPSLVTELLSGLAVRFRIRGIPLCDSASRRFCSDLAILLES